MITFGCQTDQHRSTCPYAGLVENLDQPEKLLQKKRLGQLSTQTYSPNRMDVQRKDAIKSGEWFVGLHHQHVRI